MFYSWMMYSFFEKTRTQEELFHTFEALQNAGKQMYLQQISLLKIFLDLKNVCVLVWNGMMADIHPPEIDTLLAILEQKSQN